jgi:hypothetical protein
VRENRSPWILVSARTRIADMVRPVLLITLVSLIVAYSALGQCTSEDACATTARMQVFSNAFESKETGDVGGFELAVDRHNDSTVDVLLYVFEGAANDDGISLTGSISGKNLTIAGKWVEHLVEYPSKKEIVQTHFVKIGGTLDSASFQGRIEIEDIASLDKVRLKRTSRIWVCRTSDRKKR